MIVCYKRIRTGKPGRRCMIEKNISRRTMLLTSGLAILGSGFTGLLSCAKEKGETLKQRPFRISLNVSTISGFKLPVQQQIELCADAGFDGVELWTRDVEAYVAQGGSYEELGRLLKASGLLLENMIGFASWCADDPVKREEGLKQMRHDMEMTARLGGRFIAAPVQGVSVFEKACISEYASRYKAILDIGDEMGVTPILELWGAGVLNQLSDTVAIAVATGHPKASMLLDFYHLYRGGNDFESLRLINGSALPVFHINDYPLQPARTELKDSDRVFPGDGGCPFKEVLPLLYESGFRGGLSVELFNKRYWETMDAKTILGMSYEKTAQVVDRAFV